MFARRKVKGKNVIARGLQDIVSCLGAGRGLYLVMSINGSIIPEEWRELESDPGLFSLLVKEYGVKGVKVEEVYDMSRKIQGEVYGFVFLFRYDQGCERRSRKKARDISWEGTSFVVNPEIVNNMFYAHQIVVNSCATHALLSILLNCPQLDIGSCLSKLKSVSAGLDPERKGLAIADMTELSVAHNKFAKPTVTLPHAYCSGALRTSAKVYVPETFHYISFVPINGRLFELDGLKEHPIDHGPWGENEDWSDLFLRVISERLAKSENFLFNLMALIPDPLYEASQLLNVTNKKREESLQDAVDWATRSSLNVAEPDGNNLHISNTLLKVAKTARTLPSDEAMVKQVINCKNVCPIDQLKKSVAHVLLKQAEMKSRKHRLNELLEAVKQYRVDHLRRVHDYEPFITAFITMLAENNQLPQHILKSTFVKVNSGRLEKFRRRPRWK